MRRDRIIVFLLRRRYLLAALAMVLAAAMFLAVCLPELLAGACGRTAILPKYACRAGGKPARQASLLSFRRLGAQSVRRCSSPRSGRSRPRRGHEGSDGWHSA